MSPANAENPALPPAPLWGFLLGRFIMTVMQGVVLTVVLLLWALISDLSSGPIRLILVSVRLLQLPSCGNWLMELSLVGCRCVSIR